MTATLVTASYPAGLVLTNANYNYVSVAGTAVTGNPGGPALSGATTIGLTIANSGTIHATGTTAASYGINQGSIVAESTADGVGVVLANSGYVGNAASGIITSAYIGVVQSRAGTVVSVVTYIHVELPAHDVVLAEGLPAESYLDTGNRAGFVNGGEVIADVVAILPA